MPGAIGLGFAIEVVKVLPAVCETGSDNVRKHRKQIVSIAA
jgi:hypothetical protein